MTINLKVPDLTELKPRITVIGVGGAGGNAVNNMIATGLEGCDFVVANTDAQALATSRAARRIQMGSRITEGLGAGSKPEIGAAAAEEALADIKGQLVGSHMVFITAGMGGGTGTGAAPVIARAAQEEGILTVGVVTKPFQFEGQRRMQIADLGIVELHNYVDTLIIIPNQNLFRVANEKTTFADAFALADRVLHSGVACITDLMVKEGLINLDFADVKTVMHGMGKAMMGTGQAAGEQRALEAAEAAISNPLLDDVSMRGAGGLLISITGGSDMTLYEVDEAASRIREEVAVEANIILGATFDESLEGHIRVSVVATGLDSMPVSKAERPAAPVPAAEPAPPARRAQPEPQSNRLAERIDNLQRPQAAPARAQAGAPDAHKRGWQGSDDVTIEKRAPRPVPLAPLSAPPAERESQTPRETFAPQPPAAAKRPPRRMPAVEDLPPVAQNALRFKDGSGSEAGLQAQKKKVGFLERITRMRPRNEEPEPRRDREPNFDTPRPQQPAAPKGTNTGAPSKTRLMRQAGTVKPQSSAPAQAAQDDEELEIPAFLRRQAN